jgi:hypothetical protein
MKYILIAIALCVAACDKPESAKIAAPQRAVLDKARTVDQTVQKNTDETKQKAEEAEK